jgi:uncharacterized integral membrane protein (TIGR00698 family)
MSFSVQQSLSNTRKYLPGFGLAAVVVGIAFAVEKLVKGATPVVVSPLVVAVALGAVLANLRAIPTVCRPGLQFGARKFLRIGIVLLGLQLKAQQIRDLGPRGLLLVLVVVGVTFISTQKMGRRLGLSDGLSLMVATGFSICGASAIAAMRPQSDADDDDTAYAVALVTICGTLAIILLPIVGRLIGFSGYRFGAWVGASVHDVAQTVATASTGNKAAQGEAIVVKLTRVVLLAPMVAFVSMQRRHAKLASGTPADGKRLPLVPLFVAGFLAAIAFNSIVKIPTDTAKILKYIEKGLLAAALVGLGAGVDLRKFRAIGLRPLVLGLGSWVMIATLSAIGVVVLHIG